MSEHKERPILFSGPMVRAILDCRKTQTRRIAKPVRGFEHYNIPKVGMPHAADPWAIWWHGAETDRVGGLQECPYGKPGDRLWVRETWSKHEVFPDVAYRADGEEFEDSDGFTWAPKWRSSLFMPRWASRITLEVVSVRAERLQAISEADAIAEGVCRVPAVWGSLWGVPLASADHPGWEDPEVELPTLGRSAVTAVGAYQKLWEHINGPGSWAANPLVWVVEFRRVESEEQR